jgi:hypothetical protein
MSVIVGPTSGTPVFIRRLPFYRGGGAAAFANVYSILLDGVNEGVSHGDVFAFERTTAFSLACWYKPTGVSGAQVLFGRQGITNFRGYSFMLLGTDYRVELTNSDASNRIHIHSSGVTVEAGKWQFACLTYDGSSTAAGVTIYHCDVGDVPAATAKTTIANNLSATMVEAGLNAYQGQATWGGYFGGNLDSTTVWNKALSLAEVQALAAATDYSGLSFFANCLLWAENGDSGDTTAAISNRANPGTATGAGVNTEAGDIEADVRA